MNVQEYLDLVAYKKEELFPYSDEIKTVYRSKFDDSYITMEGIPHEFPLTALAKFEITEHLTHGIGFSPKHNKWYGWSHRGIAGFTIGSECKKGHCHYRPGNEEEELKDAIRFYSDPNKKHVKGKILRPGLIEISYDYRSLAETTAKYWFNYPEFPLKERIKFFIGYSFLPWFTDFKMNKIRIKQLIWMIKEDFMAKNKTHSFTFEYDPNEFGRGEWIAKTMEDAKQMAIDYNDGIS